MALAENPTSPQCSLTSGASLAISTSPRTHARARSHLFPSSSRGESWLGFGPLKGWVGRPQHTCTHKRAPLCVPYGVLRVFFVVHPVCTLRGSLCPLCVPYGVLCVLLCLHYGILCRCTLVSTSSRWLFRSVHVRCRSVPARSWLRLRVAGCAGVDPC